ncbi:unnamed protein product [Rhizophagus irregularis]|nr:unnamed protein product [Rhizophagus irregularis]
MSQPQIVIDLYDEIVLVCRLLYYNIPGFYTNAKKLHKACQEEGYSFRIQDITKWLKHQYNSQIYRQPLPCKAEASFSKIKIPNKVHQCDILLHTYDQDGGWVFVCTLLVIDVATRFKDGRSLTSRNSLEIWIAIKDIYEDPSNPLTWPKLLMTDCDASFQGAFSRGMQHKTRLIGMSPARAMTLEEVELKPSKKPKRAIGKDEEIKLQKGTAVRYLLKAGELEGDHRCRASDPYWSLRVFTL